MTEKSMTHADAIEMLVKRLRESSQTYHAQQVSDRWFLKISTPHRGRHFLHCPALECQESKKVLEKVKPFHAMSAVSVKEMMRGQYWARRTKQRAKEQGRLSQVETLEL